MLFITAFTQPILMERKVDLATAVLTSVNAVWLNKVPMLIWGRSSLHRCDWLRNRVYWFHRVDAYYRLRRGMPTLMPSRLSANANMSNRLPFVI